jgi:hypothetical protein
MNFLTSFLLLLFTTPCLIAQEAVPYKPKDDFEVKIDMQFKTRPSQDNNTVTFTQTRKSSSDVLPYLTLQVTLFKLAPEEVRYKVENNKDKRVVSKKLPKTPILAIDAGFTDDIKALLVPSEYVITLMTDDKTAVSQILIQIEKDGSFLVNGEKRGKF